MMNCAHCGGRLRRIHRTFFERFSYLGIYQCRRCERVQYFPRHYRFHLGPSARCPRCGTYRITKLKGPDKIDPMASGLLNWLERRAGGHLHHCCFCRVQFYARRGLAAEAPHPPEESGARQGQPVAAAAVPPDSR